MRIGIAGHRGTEGFVTWPDMETLEEAARQLSSLPWVRLDGGSIIFCAHIVCIFEG